MQVRASGAAFALLLSLALAACSKEDAEPQPVVTVQTATVKAMTLQEMVTSEAVLYPRNQAAITPKIVAPVRRFYVNRGSHVHKGELLAVLENRDISAAVTENQGAFEQAQAQFDTTTQASLPEDLHKAELGAKAAKEAFDAQQKLHESRQKLFSEGALPRKD